MGSEKRNGEAAGETSKDSAARIGSSHGEDTEREEKTGYARDIGPAGGPDAAGPEARVAGSGLTTAKGHPSRNLSSRARGFGIGGGYERPYRQEQMKSADARDGLYGPLPHSGYYGSGTTRRPFKKGQAGFTEELSWYESQYGDSTSGYDDVKRRK